MTNYRFLSTLLGVLTAAVLVGCSGSPSSLQMPPAATISVSSPVTSVQAGGTVQLTGTVSNASNSSVVWTVDGVPGGNSSFGTITSSGLYTAPSVPPNPPMVTITGAPAANTSAVQTTTLTITPAPPPVTVTISPKAKTVQAGSQQPFTAMVNNATDTAVIWQVAGMQGGNPTVGTISASGLYTAPLVVPNPATVTVTAVSHADPTATDSATLTISPAPPIVVSVTPSNVNLQAGVGSNFQFNAVVTNAPNNSQAVLWQVGGMTGGDATVGTISTSGLYTAPNAVPGNGIVTISAVSVDDPTAIGNSTATLFNGPPPIAVTINPTTANVNVGQQFSFTASVTPSTVDPSVTWTVNGMPGGNVTIGTIAGTIDNTGLSTGVYTAPAAVPSPSMVIVTAISNADQKTFAAATVTIGSAVTVNVAPTTPTQSVFLGQSLQFMASGNGTTNQNVLWDIPSCSTLNTCGTITTSGLYTAPTMLPNPNPVTVRATSVSDPSKSGSYPLGVTAVPTPTVTINRSGPPLSHGNSETFTATVSYDPMMQGVTWTVTCSIDGVDSDGGVPDCVDDNAEGLPDNDNEIWLSNVTPTSVTINAGKFSTSSNSAQIVVTATSVAQSTTGTNGKSVPLTITIP